MKIVWSSVCAALVFAAMSGCAGVAPSPKAEGTVSLLDIKFADAKAEVELSKLGLTQNFKAYWQARKSRNWAARFALENLANTITADFYAAYHGNGWVLKGVTVLAVEGSADAATVTIANTFVNPTSSLDETSTLPDRWVLVEGVWRHVVSDPMLGGIK
jgi:hypothetical protein